MKSKLKPGPKFKRINFAKPYFLHSSDSRGFEDNAGSVHQKACFSIQTGANVTKLFSP
jgi:hypothetical protein